MLLIDLHGFTGGTIKGLVPLLFVWRRFAAARVVGGYCYHITKAKGDDQETLTRVPLLLCPFHIRWRLENVRQLRVRRDLEGYVERDSFR